MLFKMGLVVFLMMRSMVTESQTNWRLTRDENDIKVYTAQKESSGFKEVKVEAVMEGTLQQLMTVLMDAGNNKNWVHRTKQSHVIRNNGMDEVLYYAETSLPWPLSNRDMVIKMKFDLNTSSNTLKVLATGVPDSLPEKKGLVRIKKFEAVWNVRSEGDKRILIDYFLSVNPGGNIPTGISNMFVSKGPFETFSNLSRVLSAAK